MKEKIAIISVLANAILAGGKIFIGYISNSSAILAEGFHSLTDIFSSIIGYLGIKTSEKPVDEKHPYGHYKLEVLSGVVITLILLVTGLGVAYDAYVNFLEPEKLKVGYLGISIMVLSVLINYATSRIKIYYGRKENSLTLLADGSHDKADVLASLAVLVGLIFSRYWIYADSLLAFLIGIYIVKESFELGKEAVDSLLDVSAGEEIEEKIKKIIKDDKTELVSLKTQKKGSVITANLEISLPNDLNIEKATKISDKLREDLIQEIENLSYIAIQIRSHEVEASFYKPEFGQGFGWQRKGRFQAEKSPAIGSGPNGFCVCPKCGYKVEHKKSVPCFTLKCPKCRINLERK